MGDEHSRMMNGAFGNFHASDKDLGFCNQFGLIGLFTLMVIQRMKSFFPKPNTIDVFFVETHLAYKKLTYLHLEKHIHSQ